MYVIPVLQTVAFVLVIVSAVRLWDAAWPTNWLPWQVHAGLLVLGIAVLAITGSAT